MAVFTYDPSQVTLTVGGKILSGFSDGTFITLQRKSDMWTAKTGVDGKTTRAKSSDKSAQLVFVLQQSSGSNDDMSAIVSADELTNAGVVPFMLRDGSGRTLCSALSGWFVRFPAVEFGKETMDRTWTMDTDSADFFVGGN